MKAIVSKNCRIRYPDKFKIGEGSIVDDFCYFSTQVEIGRFSHIASGCSIAGGKDKKFTLGDYCSVSSGVKVWCTSNDFVNDAIVLKPEGVKIGDSPIEGNVTLGDMCGIGANSVIMPGNNLPEGVSIGALSFVPPNFRFKPWGVYAGIPIRLIKARNKERVMEQIKKLEAQIGRANKNTGR